MGKKYIIELEDEPFGKNDDPRIPHGLEELWRVKGFKSLVFDKSGLNKLQPAEEELESAYDHGRTSAEAEYHQLIEEEKATVYNMGANDMLSAIKYLYEAGTSDGLRRMGFDIKEGGDIKSIIFKCSPWEILEKVKKHYDREQAVDLIKNINSIASECGYSLEEIYQMAKEMRDES